MHGSQSFSWISKGAAIAGTIYAARRLMKAMPHYSLAGKLVLITGGSRGLGFVLAQQLGRAGARLALIARDGDELGKACQLLSKENISATPFPCDIGNRDSLPSLIRDVTDRIGPLDVLINNAGIIKVGPLEAMNEADFEQAMNLMFWAPVHLSLAVYPHMKSRKQGQIVNITSVGGRVSVPHLVPYSCAKFALVGFSSGLSAEARMHGVNVLTVYPGLMRTGSYLNAAFTGDAQSEFAWFGISANTPGLSVSAEYAAKRVRSAIETQRQDLTISLPAKLLIASDAVLPDLTRKLMAVSNAVALPKASVASATRTGKDLNPSFGKLYQAVTALGKKAALQFNQ